MEPRSEKHSQGRLRSKGGKPKKKYRILRRVLLLLGVLTAAFIGFAGLKVWSTLHQTYQPVEASGDQDLPIEPVKKKSNEPFTVLLMGTDSRGQNDRGRPDTIILAAANPKTQKVTLLSIPRDTYVEIAGRGTQDKINHAYNYGTGTMLKTVEEFLDIPVDYYVAINFQGFEDLIDEIGGIEIDVEKRMYYRASDAYINLQPGLQVLNGEQALGYARFRRDAEGDFGRNRRQQQVIRALVDQAASLRNVDNLFAMLDILGHNVQHNIPPREIPRLLAQFRNIKGSDIDSLTMEVTSMRMGPQNLWYNLVDEEELQRLHDELAVRLELAPKSGVASSGQPGEPAAASGQDPMQTPDAGDRTGDAAGQPEQNGLSWLEKLNQLWSMLF